MTAQNSRKRDQRASESDHLRMHHNVRAHNSLIWVHRTDHHGNAIPCPTGDDNTCCQCRAIASLRREIDAAKSHFNFEDHIADLEIKEVQSALPPVGGAVGQEEDADYLDEGWRYLERGSRWLQSRAEAASWLAKYGLQLSEFGYALKGIMDLDLDLAINVPDPPAGYFVQIRIPEVLALDLSMALGWQMATVGELYELVGNEPGAYIYGLWLRPEHSLSTVGAVVN